MKKMSFAALGLAGALLLAAPAQAHFMMAYTPQTALEKAADLDFRIVFTHPAEAGHMMDMGGVKEFYALHQRGDGEAKKIDFKPLLKEITWKNPDSSAPAFSALVPRKELRSIGIEHHDVVFSPEEAMKAAQFEAPPPGRRSVPGSLVWVPASAGLLLCQHVVCSIIQ